MTRVGVDLTVLQTPHRMRGVGATAMNFINNLREEDASKCTFIFFLHKENQEDALELLKLHGINYELRFIKKPERISLNLPGRLKLVNGVLNHVVGLWSTLFNKEFGDTIDDIDTFIQFDQAKTVPKKNGLTTVLVLYDIIPYVMEADYLWTYTTARTKGKSRLGALRCEFHRNKYIKKLRLNCSRASKLIAISEHTKNDFVNTVGVDADKIHVIHLGINKIHVSSGSPPDMKRYKSTSWGPILTPFSGLDKKMFLLFVGGADPRRKLVDLFAAFNNLVAQGNDLYLVLAGDTMFGPSKIPNEEIQDYLTKHTSYLDRIYFLGFVNDKQRDWLYSHAVAFVYPSVYEGFGLPVLEAMQYGTPVITYNNTSIKEIAGDAALYADSYQGIEDLTMRLVSDSGYKKKTAKDSVLQAEKFSWGKTCGEIVKLTLHN